MKRMSLRAYAKINLFLDIEGRLDNGYHTVKSLMHSVSLSDVVDIKMQKADDTEIIISSSRAEVPTDRTNLAWRAAEKFLEAAGFCARVEIHIQKNIPIAGGLAGGSTDAAAVLRGLNMLSGEPLDTSALCDIGARLGADIPFCIVGGSKRVGGIGEVLTNAPQMPPCRLVIACGGEGVSTPWAYGELDGKYAGFDGSSYACEADKFDTLLGGLEGDDMSEIVSGMYNIFELAVLPVRPVAAEIKGIMTECGAVAAMMSGSGPSVFGIFDSDESAQKAVARLAELGVAGHTCSPVGEY